MAAAVQIIGSLLGGLQSRSAINNAVQALIDSFNKAGMTASDAVNKVNPNIYANADIWGNKMVDSGTAAAEGATAAADRGIEGINTAVSGGQAGMKPYTTAGSDAASRLSALITNPSSFTADPGYQFRLAEGQKAIQRSAAAHGASGGSGTAKALMQYNSGLASQEVGNVFSRLQGVAGLGERAAEFSGDLGFRGAATGGSFGLDAAKFGGTAKIGTTQAASNLWSHSTDEMSANSLDLANFLANMQLKTGQTQASGHMARAGVWNNMISGIGGGYADVLKSLGV